MSVKKDPSGRRLVEVEVEVPGTPEEVWQAIATGPGVSSWFVPTEIEERDGKPARVVSHFGPGMDAVAKVTAWDPPRRFAAESEWMGPKAPPIATEWIVEARSGSTCVVRVVHSLFATSDDWDGELESTEIGWPRFFRVLRLFLTHFRGEPCAAFRVMGVAAGPASTAWMRLMDSLNLSGAHAGQRWSTGGAPRLGGVVDEIDGQFPHTLFGRTDEPAPGIISAFAMPARDQVYLVVDFHLYGDRAPDVVARDEPLWRAWMNEHVASVGTV